VGQLELGREARYGFGVIYGRVFDYRPVAGETDVERAEAAVGAALEVKVRQRGGKPARGRELKRGYGGNTICERCNHATGRWYAPYFTDWCKEGEWFFEKTGGKAAYMYVSTIFPLAVLKQVVTMFLARHGDQFRPDKREPLVRFILNREQRYLDPTFRFWVYYVAPGPLRDTPVCAVLNTVTGESTFGTELSFPPYGYMMTMGSGPADSRPCEITSFSRYGALDMARLALKLEVLPTHTPVLGDYRNFKNMSRTKDEPNVVVTM
jgi:hypothetical protein